MSIDQLLMQHGGVVTTAMAQEYGVSRQSLAQSADNGTLIRAAHGIYYAQDTIPDAMFLLQLRTDKLIFSHSTALYMHELTDRDPLKYTVTLPRSCGTGRIKDSGVGVYTVKDELHEMGKSSMLTVHGNPVQVYDAERTICDILRYRNRMDQDMVGIALKRYVRDRKKNITRLMEYADAFHIAKIAGQYIGLLL